MLDLAFSIVALLQQPTPEDTLKKIEEVLREAASVRIRYKMSSSGKYSDGTAHTTERTGLLLLKEGNRIRIETQEVTTARVPHHRSETLFVSDGKKMKMVVTAGGKEINSREKDAAKDLRSLLAAVFARQGDWVPLVRTLFDRNIICPISKCGHGVDASGAKTLRFMIAGVKTELWYDGQTHAIKKQTWSLPAQDETVPFQGTIEEFAFDAQIPEEKFTVPPSRREPTAEEVLKAQVADARHDLQLLRGALMYYRVYAEEYPAPQEALEVLVRKPKNAGNWWEGPYIWGDEVPKDPWGKPYVYRFPGIRHRESFDLFSCGPDGKPDTDDDVFEK